MIRVKVTFDGGSFDLVPDGVSTGRWVTQNVQANPERVGFIMHLLGPSLVGITDKITPQTIRIDICIPQENA